MRIPLSALLVPVLALTVTLVGPTGAGSSPGAAGSPAQAPAVAERGGGASRGLTVAVFAPSEATRLVRVVVTGPADFRKVLRRATTYEWPDARPGTYKVRARPYRLYEQRVRANRPRRVVEVREHRAGRNDGTLVSMFYPAPLLCRETGGGVRAWGAGDSGQLGRSGTGDHPQARSVRHLHGISDLAGGQAAVYARCWAGGSVWVWGSDTYGALGNGAATGNRHYPIKLPGLTGVRQVAARDRGGVAMKDDGTVWSWGWGDYGQLGDGAPFDSSRIAHSPVQVDGITTATDVVAAGNTAYALLSDGTVVAWGNGSAGQLGNGAKDDSATPVPVTGLAGVAQLAAGHDFALALLESGAVWAWGNGTQGQLGQGETASSSVPIEVIASGVRQVAAGFAAGYARTTEQTLLSWGSQRHGALGNGVVSNDPVTSPAPVPDLTHVRDVASYGYSAYAYSEVQDLMAWGSNDRGQLGTGAPLTTGGDGHPLPAWVPRTGAARMITAGTRNGYIVN